MVQKKMAQKCRERERGVKKESARARARERGGGGTCANAEIKPKEARIAKGRCLVRACVRACVRVCVCLSARRYCSVVPAANGANSWMAPSRLKPRTLVMSRKVRPQSLSNFLYRSIFACCFCVVAIGGGAEGGAGQRSNEKRENEPQAHMHSS
jgi:hypothetical protein